MTVKKTFPWIFKIRENQDQLVIALVDALEARLRKRIFSSNSKPIGLATGRTMEPVYSLLVSRLKLWPDKELEKLRKGWHSFNLDEYAGLSSNDETSFTNYMSKHLGIPLCLSPQKLCLPDGTAKDLQKAANDYLFNWRLSGGISFQLLGLGLNGHVGFNEPPCYYNESCRVVKLSPSTIKQNSFAFGKDRDKVPSEAITLGIKEILSANEIHLIVLGKGKARILNLLMNTLPIEDLPASWLKLHRRVFLWADYEAFEEAVPELRKG